MPEALLTNVAEYSVSELSQALKRTVEETFDHVRVRGEITGYKGVHASGHAYFALKDAGARIEAVVWRTSMLRMRFKPEEGMEVIATGRLTTYPGASKYQIVIDTLAPAGVGALMAMIEERRRKFQAEGLFDPARKKPLPYIPRTIGVVTSATGAVIRDIIHRLTDRFPSRVVVWPVRVQGETCASEVSAAVRGFNALPDGGRIARPDLIIVARGGGSIEDLWGFNDELVVRAVAESRIPVISAVGHETDFTLVDYAADVRAPTPTAAAEAAVPVRLDLLGQVDALGSRHRAAIRRLDGNLRDRLRAAAAGLPRPAELAEQARQRLDHAASALLSGLRHLCQGKAIALTRASARISPQALSHYAVRERRELDRLGARLLPAIRRSTIKAREDFELPARRMAGSFERQLLRQSERLMGLGKLLDTLSYKAVLARGYTLVTDSRDQVVRSRLDVAAGDTVTINFADGATDATIAGGAPRPRRAERPQLAEMGQTSLF